MCNCCNRCHWLCCKRLRRIIQKMINQSIGGIGGTGDAPTILVTPNYATQTAVLTANGNYTVIEDSYIQHAFEVTNDTGWYKSIMTINGVQINAITIPNTVATGIYDYAGQIFPVMAGDVVTISLTYSSGTVVHYNYLYSYEIRN